TPELFIFDRDRRLRYHGAPDDNYDDPSAVTRRWAAEAIEALLAGREPDPATTPPLGCPIKYTEAAVSREPSTNQTTETAETTERMNLSARDPAVVSVFSVVQTPFENSAAPHPPSPPQNSPSAHPPAAAKLIFYSLSGCPTCVKAKAALDAAGTPY